MNLVFQVTKFEHVMKTLFKLRCVRTVQYTLKDFKDNMKEFKVIIKILLILICFGYIGLSEIKLILSLFTFNVATKFKVTHMAYVPFLLNSAISWQVYTLSATSVPWWVPLALSFSHLSYKNGH